MEKNDKYVISREWYILLHAGTAARLILKLGFGTSGIDGHRRDKLHRILHSRANKNLLLYPFLIGNGTRERHPPQKLQNTEYRANKNLWINFDEKYKKHLKGKFEGTCLSVVSYTF